MTKRSFIGLTGPKLLCDRIEPDPKEPESIPIPKRLVLLIHEPLDSTRETKIKKGDTVKQGERLFLYVESAEYAVAPDSGTITAIASYTGDFGAVATYLILERDGRSLKTDEFAKVAETPELATADKFLRHLPGAPPLARLLDTDHKIKTLVIEGTDSDLASTTRQYLLTTAKDDILQGIALIRQMTGIEDIAITIPEENKASLLFDGTRTLLISSQYTKALPKIIMKELLGVIPVPGMSCHEQGVVFMGVEAVVSMARAYALKEPVYEKVLTVIGKDGIRHRVKAVIGTPIHRIFKQFNIVCNDRDRIIIGGPMQGVAAYTLYHPVQPDTDTIIVQDCGEIPHVSDYPCINCGKCIRVCPANIPVNLLVRYLEASMYEEAADNFDLKSCIECGMCSYVCTSRIPLFQYIRLGKHELLKLETEETHA
ncbi:RnfC2 [Desulforapulum autotrophicum HRM2]|uniref:RnfC2 n=1 Tax=Desulforapulum autotrophicum (strain ATCC 43914 / DSM 3382 / VKM B-1955 / HRM2) TaxID=177437 RepID=C0QLI3_DESAH|nr:4Fe-4S dicluster domain-containing protein [Desulforapulum autotrophicum]ACN16287.1 RnfC2 [Desulforapulum autotrophicum HRM2]